ncbi:hypothetical protein T09_11203 [Trichinella sp. T9]|nr:hypothetical protein T09_682 [Trichinella sp. T9]KRX56818.1 hypothetical protein T09_11203 [Trichinella sp. T9]
MAATMTRFFRVACPSDFFINPTMPQPLLTHHPYFLLPHSPSQWIFYEIHAGNAALSCLLRFPESYTTCSHKNLNVLEIGRSVVLIMLRLPQDRMSCLVKSNTVENTNNTVMVVWK